MESRAFFGAERANIDLLWRMKERGAKVTCIVRSEDWPENVRIRTALSERSIAWERASFPEYPSRRYWRWWPHVVSSFPRRYLSLNRLALSLARQEQVSHIHLFNPFQAATLYQSLERSGIPVIYRCGDAPAIHNPFYRWIWSWLRDRVRCTVTESHFIREKLLDLGFPSSRVKVIRTPPPARVIKQRFDADSIGLSDLLRQQEIVFGYVGQISEAKGLAVLLDAFRIVVTKAPSARLVLAGPIADPFARNLVRDSQVHFTSRRVNFLGEIEDVQGLLGACDVHIAPSIRAESYGIVAIEAKNAGIPSIVFSDGGLVELVENGSEGIAVAEKTPEALASAMLTYCSNRERIKHDGARARASLASRLRIPSHDDLIR